MDDDRVELHNVAEMTPTADGVRLDRVPRAVRTQLNDKAEDNYTRPSGVEIRFVSDEPVRVTLSCPEGSCQVTPFWGRFRCHPDEDVTVGAEPTTIEVRYPHRLGAIDPGTLPESDFDPRIGRLVLAGNPVVLHDIETGGEIRPPEASELPDRTLLCYGTSITQGGIASRFPLSCASQTARHLNADVVNLGTGGSAFCESAIADYIADRDDWDLATLEVSVNMIAADFDGSAFRECADYLLETVAGSGRPVFVMTLFPLFVDVCSGIDDGAEWPATPEEYRRQLREAVETVDRDELTLLEGPDLLPDVTGLAPDLLHPTDPGMTQIAGELAAAIRDQLDE